MKKIPIGIIILSSIWIIAAVITIVTMICLSRNPDQPSWLFGFTIIVAVIQILLSYGLIVGDLLAWQSSIAIAVIAILLKSYLLTFSSYPLISQERYAGSLQANYIETVKYMHIEVISIVIQLITIIYLFTPAVKKYVGVAKESYSLK